MDEKEFDTTRAYPFEDAFFVAQKYWPNAVLSYDVSRNEDEFDPCAFIFKDEETQRGWYIIGAVPSIKMVQLILSDGKVYLYCSDKKVYQAIVKELS